MLLIFDCDGVLVDSEMIASRVLAGQLSAAGYPITAAECRAQFTGRAIPDIVREISATGANLPETFEEDLRARDRAAFERDLRAIPHVESILRSLPYPRCVASSGSLEKMRFTLGLTGLLSRLEPHLFSAAMVAKGKPAPDLFLLAANRMGAAADGCTVIEDSVAGVTAAKRAGMRVFGFVGGEHVKGDAGYAEKLRSAGADTVFDDMTRLTALL